MELYPHQGELESLIAATLILPAVAFANIGELAIDVIITTLKCQLVARLDDDNILACVGNNAYVPEPQGQLATALELYRIPGTKVYLLQQRAPAIPGRQQAFASSIADWARQQGIMQILLLCGLDAQYRRDHQLEGTQLRYLSSSSSSSSGAADPADQPAAVANSSTSTAQRQQQQQSDATAAACQAVGMLQLEQEVIDTEREVHSLLPPWPLLDALQQQELQHTLVATFAAEGDNVQDSLALADKVLALLQQLQLTPAPDSTSSGRAQEGLSRLQTPCSWVGLYGRGLDARSGLF